MFLPSCLNFTCFDHSCRIRGGAVRRAGKTPICVLTGKPSALQIQRCSYDWLPRLGAIMERLAFGRWVDLLADVGWRSLRHGAVRAAPNSYPCSCSIAGRKSGPRQSVSAKSAPPCVLFCATLLVRFQPCSTAPLNRQGVPRLRLPITFVLDG